MSDIWLWIAIGEAVVLLLVGLKIFFSAPLTQEIRRQRLLKGALRADALADRLIMDLGKPAIVNTDYQRTTRAQRLRESAEIARKLARKIPDTVSDGKLSFTK